MNAEEITFRKFFNGNSYRIPYYQRSYVWKEKQWERFLSDMVAVARMNKAYFLGTVILKEVPSSPASGPEFIVIDGQQRLTTLLVFYKTLSLKMKKPGIFDNFFTNSINEESSERELMFQHNHIDDEAFKWVTSLETLRNWNVDDGEIEKAQLPRIIELYYYFKGKIDVAEFEEEKWKEVLNKLKFIDITLGQDEDEQQIFDTINSLGVRLTTTELLKNYFFDEKNEDAYKRLWKSVFEKDAEQKDYWDYEVAGGSEKTPLSDLFFAAFLGIKMHDPKYRLTSEQRKAYGKISSLFNSYKDFVNLYLKGDRMGLMEEIHDYAVLFQKKFKPDCARDQIPSDPCFERINLMIFAQGWSTMLPYVLYVVKNVKDGEEQNRIFNVLESYIMRRLVSGFDTRVYYSLFSDRLLDESCLTAKGLMSFFVGNGHEVGYVMPTDDEVLKGARSQKLVNREGKAVLYMLESRLMKKDNATTLKEFGVYTLEHLMPRKWQQNWRLDPFDDERVLMRNKAILTIGNFAILPGALNTKVSNGSWHDKVNGKNGLPGLREKAAGLAMLNKYLDLKEWDEEQISNRAKDIAEKISEVWPGK